LANPSASPSLVWVHGAAGLSRRFRTWFDKACVNYGELLELGGVVDNVLRRERLEELTGEERTKFTEALMEFERLEDGLAKFITSKGYVDFVGITDEDLIKWLGDEIVSLGYCGFRERSAQYWLWDLRAEKLPFEKKVRQVFDFYGVPYRMRVPAQEESERMLFEFLENVKKWPRDRLVWLIRNVYPLSDATGGFWVVVRKVVELESVWDAWEDTTDKWRHEVEEQLKKMPQHEVLKTLMTEWEAERYERGVFEYVKNELMVKYGETIEAPDKVKVEFFERAKAVLSERVAPEERLRQVYEEIKPLVPADKVELTRAGLWKAIRWAFLHPQLSVDVFASSHVFPLGFTTEEARAIGAKIMEKVLKKPPPPPIEVQVVGSDYVHDELVAKGWKPIISIPRLEEALKRPGVGGSSTSELALEMAKRKHSPEKYDLKVVKHYALDPKFPYTVFVKEKVPPLPPPIEYVKVRFLKEIPAIVGADMKTYGPFKEGDIAELPKENAEVLVKQKIASYELVPPPPPAVPPELPTKEIDILKGVVHMKATEMKIEWTPKLWDDFWREYEARARELWATKGISFVEEEVADVLRVVAPPPPVVPPEKRPLREFPAEVDTMRDRLIREAEEVFSAYKIWEHWVTMRDSVVAMIDEVIRKYWHLPLVEAERNIHREFLDRTHEEYVKKLRPPPPPKPPPPEVPPPPPPVPRVPPYPYIPPALEYVELEADFKKFLAECGITMEDYRRLEHVGRITMREEYRRWKLRPYSS